MRKFSFVLVLVFVVGLSSAAPKVDSEAWDNFVKTGSDVFKTNENTGRSSSDSLEEYLVNYVKENKISFNLPLVGSTVTFEGRNFDSDGLSFKVKMDSGSAVEERGKKSKIKKIFIPILVFILIKAMTLIPLAMGILAIKSWNAMQLSFISFVTTLAMAVWKLCSKVSGDHPPPPQIIHEAWDPHHHHHIAAGRSDDVENFQNPMQMAYSGYAPQTPQ